MSKTMKAHLLQVSAINAINCSLGHLAKCNAFFVEVLNVTVVVSPVLISFPIQCVVHNCQLLFYITHLMSKTNRIIMYCISSNKLLGFIS